MKSERTTTYLTIRNIASQKQLELDSWDKRQLQDPSTPSFLGHKAIEQWTDILSDIKPWETPKYKDSYFTVQ